jgi:hypothetical protein
MQKLSTELKKKSNLTVCKKENTHDQLGFILGIHLTFKINVTHHFNKLKTRKYVIISQVQKI